MNKIALILISSIGIIPIANASQQAKQGVGFAAPTLIDRSKIYSPELGAIVYDSTDNGFYGFDGSSWQHFSASGGGGTPSNSVIVDDTFLAYGTTATKIARFSNTSTTGSAITRSDSSTNGTSYTINEDGIYSMTVTCGVDANVRNWCGISKNPSAGDKTTNVVNLTMGTKLTWTANTLHASEEGYPSTSWTGRLYSGDVIYVHTNGTGGSSVANNWFFRVAKVTD